MKNITKIVFITFLAATLARADTYTTRAGLVKPTIGSPSWGPKVNSNYDIMDSSFDVLTGTQTHTGIEAFTGTVNLGHSSLFLYEVTGSTYANLAAAAFASTRTYTVPDAGGDASLVLDGHNLSSTLYSSYTFTGAIHGNSAVVTAVTASTITAGFVSTSSETATNLTVSTMTLNNSIKDTIGNKLLSYNLPSNNLSLGDLTGNVDGAAQFSTFVGRFSGQTAASSSHNTGLGYASLSSITTGNSNTAIGSRTGEVLTTGTGNTIVGAIAGNAINSGTENTVVGDSAGNGLTTGTYNVVVGAAAGQGATTGTGNTVIGGLAGSGNNASSHNTAVGYQATRFLTSGTENTAVGESAMSNITTGLSNTSLGSTAMLSLTTGSSNTAVGFEAGYGLDASSGVTTGSKNTFVGFDAAPSTSAQLTNATCVGFGCRVGSSNTVQLGGNGVYAPAQNLLWYGDLRPANLPGSSGQVLYSAGPNATPFFGAGMTIYPASATASFPFGLDMAGAYITNLLDPVNPQDAATKAYADGNPTRTGDLSFAGTFRITNLPDPGTPQEAATKNYVDSGFLNLGGGAMTGAIDMSGTTNVVNMIDPTNPQDAATKNYTDAHLPKVIANFSTAPQVADISTTTAVGTSVDGVYRISFYIIVTTGDISAGSVSVGILFTDNYGVEQKGFNSSFVPLTASGNHGEFVGAFEAAAVTNIDYFTQHTGSYGTSQYAVIVLIEQIGLYP